jgi:hypothetical protein
MKTSSAKAKGRRLQQKVATDIQNDHYLPETDVVSTSMGAGGVDVQMSAKAIEACPISPECKNQESLNIWAAMKQAEANCLDGTHPVVVFTRNRSETYATLPWDSLRQILRERREYQIAKETMQGDM